MDDSDCPHTGVGCSKFLEDMKHKFKYRAESVLWGYTTTTNLLSDISLIKKATVLCTPLKGVPSLWQSRVKAKEWEMYKCSVCKFLTHALSTNKATPQVIAIVANFHPRSQKDFLERLIT